MSLEKVSVIDQITVTEYGNVLWHIAHRVMEDGELLSQVYERNSIDPGDDLSRAPAKVQAIATVVWTPELVAAFKASRVAPPVETA